MGGKRTKSLSGGRAQRIAFPNQLASVVYDRWPNMVGGDYVTPPCPPKTQLATLLEILFMTGCAAEEGRLPSFNVVATPHGDHAKFLGEARVVHFETPRSLNVAALRQLAPVVDINKSAIWIRWSDLGFEIAGLVDLGTSWSRARIGLGYRYNVPRCLIVQADRPGRLRVYQGDFRVATLSEGTINDHLGLSIELALHASTDRGLRAMAPEITWPTVEPPKEYEGFAFLALWNTYAAISNSISAMGHGGALIVVEPQARLSEDHVRVKYSSPSDDLRTAFIKFINARNVSGDLLERKLAGEKVSDQRMALADLRGLDAFEGLVEATRFVARLSACDGAVVISEDLQLIGFGAEIRVGPTELPVFETTHPFGRFSEQTATKLDPEKFGMRHRSAVKLVSSAPKCSALVVSQDGPISAVWREDDRVLVRRGINLVNMNMPWA